MTIKDLTVVLGNLTRREVIDQTGLTGLFEIHLDWTVETPVPALATQAETARPGAASDPEGADLLTSLQEQLGLILESKKAPVRVLVIDHIERPDAN
jgi:uncharacterized protein (TIGR03435 family)